MPMLTAMALLIAYACAVPIKIAAQIQVQDGKITLKTGVCAFAPPAVRRIRQKPRSRAHRIPLKTGLAFARRLLTRIRIESVRAEGRICARDAGATALICGGAESIASSLYAVGAHRIYLNLTPDFSDGATRLTVQSMISIRTGQIITAAALCAADRIKGRFFKWTDR